MRPPVPLPYVEGRLGSTFWAARPESAGVVRSILSDAGSLFAHAAGRPDRERLEGRGPAYVVPVTPTARWVVRHYRRGGLVASRLGDRYLRGATPRPLRELVASHEVSARGVPTPRVEALAVYPSGVFYRADIATRYVEGSLDLARCLFGAGRPDATRRVAACAAAGDLIRLLRECGVIHADLNLKNILVSLATSPPRAYLLDLDRCSVVPEVGPASWERMRRRFERSLRKWESGTGERLGDEERRALVGTGAGSATPAAPGEGGR